VIVNRVKNKRYELTRRYIERTLNLPVISVIPEDQAVNEALALRMPAVLYKQNAKASRCFKELSAAIFGKKSRKGFFSRFFGGVFRI
jgi:MinD-like ATPase involved in chromosome partitioning or flagellar assembly